MSRPDPGGHPPSTDEMSDEALMIRVQQGDRQAYEALYARWRERVFAFLCRRTGARTQAEEAHQETWLRVYRWRDRYDPARPFRPWLFTLAANAGRDASRPDPQIFQLEPVEGEPFEVRDLVISALHALPPLDRQLLLLVAEGFSAEEAAEMVGMNGPAVRARISRARKAMRERFDV